MPHQLLLAPDWASAEAWLLDLLSPLLRRSPLAQTRIVVPTHTLARHLEARLLKTGIAGYCGPVFTTWSGLLREVAEEAAPAQCPMRVPEALRRWSLARLVRQEIGAAGPMGRVRDFPGFVSAADTLIQELQEAGIAPETLAALGQRRASAKLQELGLLCARYARMMRDQGWTDEAQELRSAVGLLRASKLVPALRPLVLYGFDDFTPARLQVVGALAQTHLELLLVLPFDPERREALPAAEWSLQRLREITGVAPVVLPALPHDPSALSRISKQVFAPAPDKIAADASLQVLSAAGPAQMVEAIARQLRRLRQQDPGLSWAECAVLFRALPAYRPLIQEIFPQFGIPFQWPTGAPWRGLRVLLLLRRILELKTSGFAKDTLLDCLRSGYCRAQVGPAALERLASSLPSHAPPSTLEAHLNRMAEGLAHRMEPASEETDTPTTLGQERAELRAAAAGAGVWAQVADLPNRAPLSAYAGHLAQLAQALIRIPEFAEASLQSDAQGLARDRRALAELDNRLAALGRIWTAEVSLAEFLDLLDLLLQEEVLPEAPLRTDAVAIHDPLAARGLSYRVALIGGLAEKEFPAPVRPGPFLKEEEREALAQAAGPEAHLQGRADRAAKERLLFAWALEAGREQVYLVYTETDASGRPTVVSPFVEEVQALVQTPGLQVAAQYTPAEVLPRRAADLWHTEEAAAWTLDQLYRRKTLDPDGARLLARLLDQGRLGGLAAEVTRWHDPRFTTFDGDLSGQAEVATRLLHSWAGRPLSPTKLDSYAQCPWQFFAGQLLGLAGPDTDQLEISPLDRGQLIHKILERFYRQRWDEATGRARPVLAAGEAEALASIRQIALEECQLLQREGRAGHPGAWVYEQERLMVRLGWFVRSEVEYFAKHPDLAPAHLEFSFGMGERRGNDPASTDEPLRLTVGSLELGALGIIDRVDATAEGRAVVIDYKTGATAPTYAAVAKGASFQLFVYLLAAERLLGLQPEEGFYLKLADPPGAKGRLTQSGGLACGARPARGQKLPWPELKARLADFLSAYAADIAAGHFPLLPVSAEPCRFCDFQSLCRQDPTRLSGERQEDSQRFARTRTQGAEDV